MIWARLGPDLGPTWARYGPDMDPAWARPGGDFGGLWQRRSPGPEMPHSGAIGIAAAVTEVGWILIHQVGWILIHQSGSPVNTEWRVKTRPTLAGPAGRELPGLGQLRGQDRDPQGRHPGRHADEAGVGVLSRRPAPRVPDAAFRRHREGETARRNFRRAARRDNGTVTARCQSMPSRPASAAPIDGVGSLTALSRAVCSATAAASAATCASAAAWVAAAASSVA